MLAIAVPAGLLIGFSLGALGGGGSILTVPVLVYLLGHSPHAATAGSLLIVGITAAGGMIAHRRAGRVRLAPASTCPPRRPRPLRVRQPRRMTLVPSHCEAGASPPPWRSRRLPCSRLAGPWPGRVLAGPRLSAGV